MNKFLESFMAQHPEFRVVEQVQCVCKKHGKYTNTRLARVLADGTQQIIPLAGCPQCNDERNLEIDRQATEQAHHESLYRESQIPEKFLPCMLKNFRVEDAIEEYARLKAHARQVCLNFIDDTTRSLVLLGPTGRGKSHLLAAMLKGCIQTGKESLYVVERKIYREIHESYLGRKDLLTEGQVIDKYSQIPVLGIDELGRSSWTDHELQTLYEIVDNRHVHNRKTVMAGNITPEEFLEKFDDSFRRKLGAEEVVCNWGRWE